MSSSLMVLPMPDFRRLAGGRSSTIFYRCCGRLLATASSPQCRTAFGPQQPTIRWIRTRRARAQGGGEAAIGATSPAARGRRAATPAAHLHRQARPRRPGATNLAPALGGSAGIPPASENLLATASARWPTRSRMARDCSQHHGLDLRAAAEPFRGPARASGADACTATS